MFNQDKPAFPTNDAVERPGLTKLEYAVIQLAAVEFSQQGLYTNTTPNDVDMIMDRCIERATRLFERLEGAD